MKYTRVDLEEGNSGIFKKLGKHWMESLHLKRECCASLNARERTKEKKVDVGENLQLKNIQPKHKKHKECLTQAHQTRV